jgi:acetyltransferase-like isoleucine patch superfamily enzyme
MSRWIVRICLLPRSAFYRFVDQIFAPLYLRLNGAQVGKGLIANGCPWIVHKGRGQLILGNDVQLNSRPMSIAGWLLRPCVFALLAEGAVIEIGDRAGLSGALIYSKQRVTIGSDTLIGMNAMIMDTDVHPLDPDARLRDRNNGQTQEVKIGKNVFIGANSIVLQGVEIGDGAVIAAGAVVATSIPPYSLAMGNPARAIRRLKEEG